MSRFDNNPFIYSSPDERLELWKTIRREVSELPDQDALNLVAEYWGYVPLSQYSHNCEEPSTWPTPWEMVHRGEWCRNMVAVGMEFTLRLAGWDPSRMKLILMRDYDISEELMVLKIDDSVALNYYISQVTEYPKSEQVIIDTFQFEGREYHSRGV